jgi:hypothetical protein
MVWFLFLIFFLEYPAGIMEDKKTRQPFRKARVLRSAGASIIIFFSLYKRSPLGWAK